MRDIWSTILVAALTAGCGAADPPATVTTAALHTHDADNPNPGILFERDAHPYGLSLETWSELSWDWVYAIPAAHNPMLDLTGADCGVGQLGPVWFLPTVIDPGGLAHFTRRCTIPHDRALFMTLSGVVNDFPCPDPSFAPAPGQSLYAFLAAGAKPIVDSVNLLTVSLDGKPLDDVLGYRVTSDDLFYVDGSTTLQQPLDGCITGTPQPAIFDGYAIMFRPLGRGAHTIVTRATDTHGTDVTLTYDLTVQ